MLPRSAALLLVLAAGAAHAQAEPPTCAEQGAARVAVMVPPGRSADEIRAAAQGGAFGPAGTEVLILPTGHYTALRNRREFGDRMRGMLGSLLFRNLRVEGSASILLRVDEAGDVVEVRPGTGHRQLDRSLTDLWRRAKWEPYVVGGCRVPAWIQVPLNFQTDLGYTGSQMRVNTDSVP